MIVQRIRITPLLLAAAIFLCSGCVKGPDFPYMLSPRAIVQTPTNPANANITVSFQLIDREKENGNVILEYSTDSGLTFKTATLVDPSETQNLQSDWFPGIIHTVHWDSVIDMVGRSAAVAVRVKVTPSDATNPAGGTSDISGEFTVNNIAFNEPPDVTVATPAGVQSHNIQINYSLTDIEGDVCSIAVEYSVDGGGYQAATKSWLGEGVSGLSSSGAAHIFVWDSRADNVGLAGQQDNVKIRITPSDFHATGTADETDSFSVDNTIENNAPTVDITSGPEEGSTVYTNQVTFTWSGSDTDGTVVGYYYSFDRDPPNTWTTATSVTSGVLPDGEHIFRLVALDNDEALSSIATRTFTVLFVPPPVANFTASPTSGAAPLTVNFTDLSTASSGPTSSKTIGTGTVAARYPIDIAYNYARCQMLYLASEIGQAATITRLRFQRASGDADTVNTVEVHMGHTTASSIAGWQDTDSYTLVYSGNLDIPYGDAGSWFEIPLTTWFYYNGSNNLIISFRHQDGSSEATEYTQWRADNTKTGRCVAGYSNTVNPPSVTGTNIYLPNVGFEFAGTGYITSWAWDFDNNGTVDSTEQNPTHIYTNPGTYTVKLTVTGPGGSDEEVKLNYITVTPPPPWAKTYGDTRDDYAYSIQQTSDNGYVVAGTGSFASAGYDFWVLKLNSDGTVSWQKRYGGTGDDKAYSIQQTSDSGYVVAGTGSFASTAYDFWVLKLNSDGTVAWQKAYGRAYYDNAYSIQQTGDGGYIVAGDTGASGAGNYDDFWVLKLDSEGGVSWQKTYGGTYDDWLSSIQQTSDGGYIVAGCTFSFGGTNGDFWVLKLNSDGTVSWQKRYGGDSADGAHSIQQTSDGGYIVAGHTFSFGLGGFWVLKLDSGGTISWQKTYSSDFNDHAYSIQQTTDGGYIVAGDSFGASRGDSWVLKLNTNGTIAWQKRYGGTGDEAAESIQQTSDGGYVMAGCTNSFGADRSDFWVLKVKSNGIIAFNPASGAQMVDTYVVPVDTNCTGVDTTATVADTSATVTATNATVTDTNATIMQQAP